MVGAESDAPTSRLPSVSGPVLLAVSVIISPDTPLLFLGRADLSPNPGGRTGILSLHLSPLRASDRGVLAGADLVVEGIQVGEDLRFSADLGQVSLIGEANPISGGNIAAHLMLDGRIVSPDSICGNVLGMAMEPVSFDLAGSTFASTRVTEGVAPASLPNPPPLACP